jgi:outer membrane protein assembly factor BamB
VLEDLWTAGHHYRCYPGKATSNYILTAKRGIEMFDLAGDDHSRNNWVRGTCRVGVTPCNGLIYVPPHSCGCYMEAKLFGFWALAADGQAKDDSKQIDLTERLHKGPAFGHTITPATSSDNGTDWPTYRGDATRSGSTTSAVSATLGKRWQADLGGRLSAITAAGGILFVVQKDAHTVQALDAETGQRLWQYTAGGRVDSPPTIHGGLALFGSRDGWVYCLRVSDGELVWRFQAAPEETSAVAYDQVESLWPVHGSVLVHDDVAYAAAGRSSHLDGGIVLYGLDPATGEILCTTGLSSEHAEVLTPPSQDRREEMDYKFSQNHTDYKTFLAPDKSDAFSMDGALADVMVADGESIFMRHLRFDRQLTEQEEKLPHLFSTSSLLDDREHNRSYWAFGTADFSRTPVAYPWIVGKSMAVPYGVILAFDSETVWGIRRVGKTFDYAVFAAPRPDPAAEESLLPDFAERSGRKKPLEEHWVAEMPIRPRAMIRVGDKLVVGGMANEFDPKDPGSPINATYAGKGKGLLRVVSTVDGNTLGKLSLDAPPVWNGITPAGKRLFVATRAGAVVCLGGQ